jgi:hypothetical protein
MRVFLVILLAVLAGPASAEERFQSDSKRFGNPKMDIVLTELERLPKVSVVGIAVSKVGSSVGSSFFVICSLHDLAKLRGGYRYIAKVENQPSRNQMVVGFLQDANESPATLDPRLVGQAVIDLEQFAPICDRMK